MKKTALIGLVSSVAILGGCATSYPIGGLYTGVKLPVVATSNGAGTKVGKATCQSILALVATGDCSISAAKANGGIKEVTHVDWKADNILGIIGNYEVTVYGN